MSRKPRINYRELAPPGAERPDRADTSPSPAAAAAAAPAAADEPGPLASPITGPAPAPVVIPAHVDSPLSIARRVQRASGEHAAAPELAQSPGPRAEPEVATVAPRSLDTAQGEAVDERKGGERGERHDPLPLRDRARARTGTAELLVFRVGRELFGVELVAVDEAVDTPMVHPLPGMADTIIGVFSLRGSLVSLYAPTRPLGVAVDQPSTSLVFCSVDGQPRVALAADDVDDLLTVQLEALRGAPGADTADGVLLGVACRGRDLVAVLDVPPLLAACRGLATAIASPEAA